MAKSVEQLGIETTTMAIRELLMEYFKGTCVERFTEGTRVEMVSAPGDNRYQYQRVEYQQKRPRLITIGGLPIIRVERAPDAVQFKAKVLKRSPQLRAVYKGIGEFFDNYLSGVKITHDEEDNFYVS